MLADLKCRAKVDQLPCTVTGTHQIVRADVAVDDPARMQPTKSFEHRCQTLSDTLQMTGHVLFFHSGKLATFRQADTLPPDRLSRSPQKSQAHSRYQADQTSRKSVPLPPGTAAVPLQTPPHTFAGQRLPSICRLHVPTGAYSLIATRCSSTRSSAR